MQQRFAFLLLIGAILLAGSDAPGQSGEKKDPDKDRQDKKEPDKKGPGFGKGGPGGFFKGGFGGMMGQRRELVKQFDKDGDGRLNKDERKAAREFLKKSGGPGGFRPGGPGGPGGRRGFRPGNFLAKPLL